MVYIGKLPMQSGENELDQWKVLRRVLLWSGILSNEAEQTRSSSGLSSQFIECTREHRTFGLCVLRLGCSCYPVGLVLEELLETIPPRGTQHVKRRDEGRPAPKEQREERRALLLEA